MLGHIGSRSTWCLYLGSPGPKLHLTMGTDEPGLGGGRVRAWACRLGSLEIPAAFPVSVLLVQ